MNDLQDSKGLISTENGVMGLVYDRFQRRGHNGLSVPAPALTRVLPEFIFNTLSKYNAKLRKQATKAGSNWLFCLKNEGYGA